ncbi:MAG: ATP-dependent DNA ligase [Halobacteriota archaeon]
MTYRCARSISELNGEDFRKRALLDRKTRQQKLLAKTEDAVQFNEHIEGAGSAVFQHACKLGYEGIVAKRKDLPYESGRSRRWLKIKNPDSPAMQRVRDGTF